MSAYSADEQAEILDEAKGMLKDALDSLHCIDGDQAEAARFDVQTALDRVGRIGQDLATATAR